LLAVNVIKYELDERSFSVEANVKAEAGRPLATGGLKAKATAKSEKSDKYHVIEEVSRR
jgi:hypothetical protein